MLTIVWALVTIVGFIWGWMDIRVWLTGVLIAAAIDVVLYVIFGDDEVPSDYDDYRGEWRR